jgi:hypothetical protein
LPTLNTLSTLLNLVSSKRDFVSEKKRTWTRWKYKCPGGD